MIAIYSSSVADIAMVDYRVAFQLMANWLAWKRRQSKTSYDPENLSKSEYMLISQLLSDILPHIKPTSAVPLRYQSIHLDIKVSISQLLNEPFQAPYISVDGADSLWNIWACITYNIYDTVNCVRRSYVKHVLFSFFGLKRWLCRKTEVCDVK